MPRKQLTPEQQRRHAVDRIVAEVVRRRCDRMPISVMKIGDVYKAAYAADLAGQDIETAVFDAYSRFSSEVQS